MTEQLSNFGSSLLLNAIADTLPGTFTLVADGGDVFPTSGDFRVRINNELILCSARSGDIITMSDRGIEDTTATIHGEGDAVYQVLTVAGLDNYLEDRLDQGTQGDPGDPGPSHIIFTQRGEAQLSTGSKPYPMPWDYEIFQVDPFCSTPPTEDPIELTAKIDNVEITPDPDRPFVPVGAYNGDEVLLSYEGDKGDLLTVDVTAVGLPAEGGDVTMDVRSVSDPVSSLTATKSNFNIPIPASYQVGDLLLCPFVVLFTTVTTFPDGWTEISPVVEETTHSNSLHLYVIGKIAEASESAVQSVVFAGGTPMEAVTLAIKNPQAVAAQPDDTDTVEVGVAQDDATLPAISSSIDDDLGIWMFGGRYFEGITGTIALDPDLTLDYSGSTTRSTQLNCGLAVGHKLYPTPTTSDIYGASVDSSLFVRWVGRNMMLFQGNAGGTPGVEPSLDVWFRERT